MTTGTSAITRLMNDTRSRSLFFQFLLLAGIILGLWWIVDNTVTNLSQQNKSVGFGFLFQTAGFQINTTLGTWMFDYQVGKSTYLDVYYIGIVNTFIVAFFGIFAATFIGFLLGIMRLSQNFVLRIFATSYIEVVRNVPLLLQLFFWYFAVLRTMPNKRGKIEIIPDVIGVNITGLYLPAALPAEGFGATVYAFLAAVLITFGVHHFAKRRQLNTGKTFPTFWAGLGILVLIPLMVFNQTGSPLVWEFPEFKETGAILRRGYQQGVGILIIGILAVNKGQTEASMALGLKPGRVLRLVIIPQAMRIIIPPLTSQYLNLTKNSSLAVAIAYPELVSIFAGTALNQVGREIEMVFMMMSVYLTFSIITSVFMNWFNSRVKLTER
jgi:general L-amino acid transport system permease protein